MATARFQQLYDGSIIFHKRGMPPQEVPGFEVDPGDPYVFHPILPPCKKRVFKEMKHPCCIELKMVRCCEKFGYIAVVASQCITCANAGNSEP